MRAGRAGVGDAVAWWRLSRGGWVCLFGEMWVGGFDVWVLKRLGRGDDWDIGIVIVVDLEEQRKQDLATRVPL